MNVVKCIVVIDTSLNNKAISAEYIASTGLYSALEKQIVVAFLRRLTSKFVVDILTVSAQMRTPQCGPVLDALYWMYKKHSRERESANAYCTA